MKVSIHQPEHFPYFGFFQKMQACDVFVILDDVSYRKNYFQNRNRFLNQNGVEEWFTIELKKYKTGDLINQVLVSPNLHWKKKILKKLNQNFKYDFSEIYNNEKLVEINMNSIYECMRVFNINKKIIFSSELDINETKSSKLSAICNYLGASEYISGPSGRDYLELDQFNCKVTFFEPKVENHYSSIQFFKK
jgi:hypothetical protein